LNCQRNILIFVFICVSNLFFSQDIHFSQFDASLLNLSPAYTGLFDGDYRFSSVYRSQWSAVPVSYSTFNFNAEGRYLPNLRKSDRVGIGLMFNSDKAGDSGYGTNQIYLSGSYSHYLKADSSLLFSYGANIGFCSVGFDYSKMTFDSQYSDGLGFNRTITSGENFARTRKNYADFNLGFALQYVFNKINKLTFATSAHHLSRPNINYQGTEVSRLDIKTTNCISFTRPISSKIDIITEALLNFQGKNYELIPHLSFKYYTNKFENQAILAGMCWRSRDAFIFRLGYQVQSFQSGVAYDINISKFNAATNRRGAFELFVNYIIKSKPGFVAKKRQCPSFM